MLRLALVLLLFPVAASAQSEEKGPARFGVTVADSLAPGRAHRYTLQLEDGEMVRGVVVQLSADVEVRVRPSDGAGPTFASPLARGPEPFRYVARETAEHYIEIESVRGGRYALTVQRPALPAEAPEAIAREWLDVLDADGRPGAAVAVVRGGRVVWSVARGRTALEGGRRVTDRTPFYVGDLSASMVAYGALVLAQAGALDLDADPADYLPTLPRFDDPASVRDLVLNTAPYRDVRLAERFRVQFGAQPLAEWLPTDGLTPEAEVAVLSRQRLLARRSRTRYRDNPTDDALLALILEAASGEPLAAWMEANVFRPLGMRDAHVGRPEGGAVAYTVSADGEIASVDPARGGVGVYASVRDLARWAHALREGGPIGRYLADPAFQASEHSYAAAYVPVYGLRLDLNVDDGEVLRAASETFRAGVLARFGLYSGSGEAVIVLSAAPEYPLGLPERRGSAARSVYFAVERAVVGDGLYELNYPPAPPAPPPPNERPPLATQAYAGEYVNAETATRLRLVADREQVRVGSAGRSYLWYSGNAERGFGSYGPVGTIRFFGVTDASGVAGLRVTLEDGDVLWFWRVSAPEAED